jgi:hypothetical protein
MIDGRENNVSGRPEVIPIFNIARIKVAASQSTELFLFSMPVLYRGWLFAMGLSIVFSAVVGFRFGELFLHGSSRICTPLSSL